MVGFGFVVCMGISHGAARGLWKVVLYIYVDFDKAACLML